MGTRGTNRPRNN